MAHKFPTISVRISDFERREIEARIQASGMRKKDYFIRSCIYNRVCVVGKKETILPLVDALQQLGEAMEELGKKYGLDEDPEPFTEEMEDMAVDYLSLLKAVIWMLDGARYLWQDVPPYSKDD